MIIKKPIRPSDLKRSTFHETMYSAHMGREIAEETLRMHGYGGAHEVAAEVARRVKLKAVAAYAKRVDKK